VVVEGSQGKGSQASDIGTEDGGGKKIATGERYAGIRKEINGAGWVRIKEGNSGGSIGKGRVISIKDTPIFCTLSLIK